MLGQMDRMPSRPQYKVRIWALHKRTDSYNKSFQNYKIFPIFQL